MDEFERFEDTNVLGGFAQVGANTLDECMDACSESTSCLAFDFDENTPLNDR